MCSVSPGSSPMYPNYQGLVLLKYNWGLFSTDHCLWPDSLSVHQPQLLCTMCYVTGSSVSVIRVYKGFCAQHTCSSGMSGDEWVISSLRYLIAWPILTDKGWHCVKKLQNTKDKNINNNDKKTVTLYKQHSLSGRSSLEMVPLLSHVLLQITPSDYKRMQLQHCQKSVLPVLCIVQATIYDNSFGVGVT